MGHTGDTKWVWLSQARPFLRRASRLLASLCLSSSVSSPLGAVRHQGAQVQDLSPAHGTYSVAAANAAVRALLALSFSTLRVQGLLSLPKLTRSPYGNSKHCPDTDHPKYTWHSLLHSRLPRPAPSTGSSWAFHGISRSRPPGTNFDSTPSLPHLGTSSKLDVILDPSVSHPHPLSGNTVGSTHNIEPGSAHLSLYSPTCSWAITAASSLPQLPTPPPPSVP